MSTCSKLAYVALVFTAAPLVAQRRPDNTVMVSTFRANGDKETGAKASASLRERIEQDFSSNKLSVPKTEDVLNYLDASGFLDPETHLPDSLDPPSEYELARKFSADMYVTGDVLDRNGNYRVTPIVILTSDKELNLRQPLPVQTSDNLDDAMKEVSRSLRNVIREVEANRKCMGSYRSGKIKEALASYTSAVAEYPNATLVRLCAQGIYLNQYDAAKTHADSVAYADSALAVATQILKIDSLSPLPLQASVRLYRERNDTTHWLASVLRLAQTSQSGDTKTLQDVIAELAGAGHYKEASQLVKTLLEKANGEPGALELAFLVYSGSEDWANTVSTGLQLVQADSTRADSSYYLRMANAYAQLKQPGPATELLAEATARNPRNALLWLAYSQALEKVGQLQQSKDARKKVVELDPKQFGGLLFASVQDFYTAKQYDSAYTALTTALAQGADTTTGAQLALGFGGELLRAGSSDPSLLVQAVKFASLSNKTSASSKAQLIAGAAAFSIMQNAVTTAQKSKSCTDAQLADNMYNTALPALTAAAKAQEPQSAQMLEYLPKFRPAITSEVKQFCK